MIILFPPDSRLKRHQKQRKKSSLPGLISNFYFLPGCLQYLPQTAAACQGKMRTHPVGIIIRLGIGVSSQIQHRYQTEQKKYCQQNCLFLFPSCHLSLFLCFAMSLIQKMLKTPVSQIPAPCKLINKPDHVQCHLCISIVDYCSRFIYGNQEANP